MDFDGRGGPHGSEMQLIAGGRDDATAANSAGLSELPENDFDAFPDGRHVPLEGAYIASYYCDVLIYLGKSRIDQSEAPVEHVSLRTEAPLERHVEIIERRQVDYRWLLVDSRHSC